MTTTPVEQNGYLRTTATEWHVCEKHPTIEHRNMCLVREPATYTGADAKAVGMRSEDGRDWPYGPNICGVARNRLVDWATREGLRLSRAGAYPHHLDWLLRGSGLRGHAQNWQGGILDHVTRWNRGRKPALLLCQPYAFPVADVDRLRELWPVDVEVSAEGPWYGYGTLGVTITVRGR